MGGLVNKFTNGKHNDEWLNCTCDMCGRKFHDKESHIKKCKNHFCSKSCFYESKKHSMKGSGNHQYGLLGNKNASWKSDRKISRYGYIAVRMLDHPMRDKSGFVFEHRIIAEKYLLNDENSIEIDGKRYLKKEYDVHHINFNRLDNRVENLAVLTRSEHRKLHNSLNPSNRDKNTGKITTGKVIAKRISKTAKIPKKIVSDIPMYELYSWNEENIIIPVNGTALIHTGEAFDIPKAYCGVVYFKHRIDKENVFDNQNNVKTVTWLDSGEVVIPIENKTGKEMIIEPHENIGILAIQPVFVPDKIDLMCK